MSAKLLAGLKTAVPPFTPERERELIALAYGHTDKAIAAAAMKLVQKHVAGAAEVKAALRSHLGWKHHVIDERLRKLKRSDRALIATKMVDIGVNAHGLAFEENPEFAREWVHKLVRPKTKELYLTEAQKKTAGRATYVKLTTIPDVVFDELPKLRGKFDKLTIWGASMTTLPDRFVELAPMLKTLVLGFVDFTELPECVLACKQLESLTVHSYTLGKLHKRLPELTRLKHLEVTHSNVMRRLPFEICDVSTLESLNLNSTKITAIPPEIGKLTKLKRLSIQGSAISKLPPELATLPLNKINVRWSKVSRDAAKALLRGVTVES